MDFKTKKFKYWSADLNPDRQIVISLKQLLEQKFQPQNYFVF